MILIRSAPPAAGRGIGVQNEKRAAERKKRGHDRGSDAFIGRDGDDSRKRHPLTAGYNATGHQLSGNLKEKRTGETAGGARRLRMSA